MSFIVYDLILLVIFVSLVSLFLYKNKKNLKKDGWLILYRTEWGLNLIEKTGKKYPKFMKILSYVSITIGYILMVTGIYLFVKILLIYFFRADVVAAVKVPPIMPLIPYLPQMFKLSWLPDFYFIYWIIILAIVAITHEFAHGIFSAYHGIKVKKTGFGFFPYFLPVFLAAFVEPDEEKMQKAKTFKQLSILSAGTFANILTAIISFGLMALFFIIAFSPSGVIFTNYAYTAINTTEITNITSINGVLFSNTNLSEDIKEITFLVNGTEYYTTEEMFTEGVEIGKDYFILAYYNSPAFKSKLSGTIVSINGEKINSLEDLNREISKYSPSEKISVRTIVNGSELEYNITLEESPSKNNKSWIGIAFQKLEYENSIKGFVQRANSYKNPNLYYTPNFGEFSNFIYNLLWWLFLISISVAVVNMLPVGIFDGGRFFYLTILAITKKEKIAKKTFSFMTYLFLALLLVLMFFWAKSFF